MPTRIFISYARKHEGFVRQLATALSDSGAEVWVDIEDIPAGMNWSRAVQEGLDACDVMLVIITPESMQSRNVENEWQYYFDENKPVIPIRLVDAKTHFQLRRLQYIDFERQSFDAAYANLLRELARLGVGVQPLADAEAQILPSPPTPPLPRQGGGSQNPDDNTTPLLDEVEMRQQLEDAVNKKTLETPPLPVAPDPQNIELRNKHDPPPKPAARRMALSPVLLVGILAAVVLGGLVTVVSFNLNASVAAGATQTASESTARTALTATAPVTPQDETATAAQETFQAGVVGSAVAGTPMFSENVAGTLTAEAAAPEATEAVSAGHADLIITGAFTLDLAYLGMPVQTRTTITNIGDAPASGFTLTSPIGDPLMIDEIIEVGESIEVDYPVVPDSLDSLTFDLIVDADNVVDEGDLGESNNVFQVTITVYAPDETAEATEPVAFTWGFNPDVARFKDRPLIVYASPIDGDYDLYLYDTGSDEIVPLTINDCNDTQPSWSPDGVGIIFVSDCDGSDDEIFIFDELGIEQRQVTFDDARQSSPVWVGGDHFYYWMHLDGVAIDTRQAWSMTTQGIGISQLTDGIQNAGEVLTASPDGAYLAYTQEIDEFPRLVLYNIETRTPQFVGDPDVGASKPRWSPTRNQILYVGYESNEGEDRLIAYSVDSDSYEWWATSHEEILYPSWHPYSDRLLIAVQVSNDDFMSGLYLFDRESEETELLIDDETITYPMWRPDS